MHLGAIACAVGTAIGIIAGFLSPVATEIAVTFLLIGIAQTVLLLYTKKSNMNVALFTLLISVGVVTGVVRTQLLTEKGSIVCDRGCTVKGEIVKTPVRSDTYQTIVLHSDDHSYDVIARVPLYPQLHIGERVEVSGKATIPSTSFPHHGEKTFDYASYLLVHSIGSEMMYPSVRVVDEEAHSVIALLGRVRESLVARLEEYISSPESSLASGMLFGDDSMSKDIKDAFRVAGLSHVVVLSGFNIAIVIAVVLVLLAYLPLLVRILFAALFVSLFVMMVGGEASVIRATLMAFIGLLAMISGREYVARQALLISFIAIVLYEPRALLYDASLHLSFLASAGIIYMSKSLTLHIERYAPLSFSELVSTTLAAYISTLPYIAYSFGNVSLYALLANLLVLPFVPLAMLVSFLVVMSSFIAHPLALIFGYVDTALLSLMIKSAEGIASLPYASVAISFSWMGVIGMYGVIVVASILYLRYKNETNETRTEQGYITDIISY